MRSFVDRRVSVLGVVVSLACVDAGDEDGGDGETGEPQVCEPVSTEVVEGPGAQILEQVASRAQIPGLADQPTAHGQVLSAMEAYDGRLHLGYGDYDKNTGPISAQAWDPALEDFVDFGVLPTEEVRGMFLAHGSLYVPAIDPDGHQESGGVYRLDCGAAQWSIETPISGAVHVYDLAAQGDTLYTGTGSLTGKPSLLMASDDRGASWTELFRHESPADGFSRIYYVGATPEQLFFAGRDHGGSGETFAWVRRGAGEPEALADPPSGPLASIVLGSQLYIAEFSSTPGFGQHLGTYVIEGAALAPAQPWPELDGAASLISWTKQPADAQGSERLLVLMADGAGVQSVHASADLGAGPQGWTELAILDPGALAGEVVSSMALLHNDLYLGTRAGSLWALRELELAADP